MEPKDKLVVLLTGNCWDGRNHSPLKGDTHRVEPYRAKQYREGYWLDTDWYGEPEPNKEWGVIEVPYMIGQKVKLTGSAWGEMNGDFTTVDGYDDEYLPLLDNGFYATPSDSDWGDWSVMPVEDGHFGSYTLGVSPFEVGRREVETEVVKYIEREAEEKTHAIFEELFIQRVPNVEVLKRLAEEGALLQELAYNIANGHHQEKENENG